MRDVSKPRPRLHRADYAHIVWERRIVMLGGLAAGAMCFAEGWIGQAALAGVMLSALAAAVLWTVPDHVAWTWRGWFVWLLALMLLLGVRGESTVFLHQLRDFAALLWPLPVFAALMTAGAMHRRRLTGQKPDGGVAAVFLLGILLFTLCWMNCANQLYDRHAPDIRNAQVVSRQKESGYKGAARYYAMLTYPDDDGKTVTFKLPVSQAYYETLESGEPVTLSLYPGAFGVGWYTGEFGRP